MGNSLKARMMKFRLKLVLNLFITWIFKYTYMNREHFVETPSQAFLRVFKAKRNEKYPSSAVIEKLQIFWL